MDRVEYHLERLLPSLQLLHQLELFQQAELQQLTQRRREYETSLISRGVDASKYHEYIGFETDFTKLATLRIRRAGKDDTGNDKVTMKDRNQLKRFMERHTISIWQRMISKLGPKDHNVFLEYLSFLEERKMRRVYSEVAAQALSMHPMEAKLWIVVASWELNSNLDASAARMTLLRGIRLNTTAAVAPSAAAESSSQAGRRRKKARRDQDEDVSTPSDAASTSALPPSLALPKDVPSPTKKLTNLWLAYFRMELVFMERLRRRWAVLGIHGGQQNEKEANATASDADSDDEDSAAGPTHDIDEEDKQGEQAAKVTAPHKLLSGALPIAIVCAALDLRRDSDADPQLSSPSLPTEARYLFLTMVFDELTRFGREVIEDDEAGMTALTSLQGSLTEAIRPLAATEQNAKILALLKQRQRLQQYTLQLRAQETTGARTSLSAIGEAEQERKVRERKDEQFTKWSDLRFFGDHWTKLDDFEAMEEVYGDAATAVLRLLEESSASVHSMAADEKRAQLHLLRAIHFEVSTDYHELILRSRRKTAPNAEHIKGFLACLKASFDELRQGGRLLLNLRVRFLIVVWRALAYRSDAEGGDEQTAVESPLLPFVSAALLQAGKEGQAQLKGNRAEEIRLLVTLSRYTALEHASLLQQQGSSSTASSADLVFDWSELNEEMQERASGRSKSSDADSLLRARIWVSLSACKIANDFYDNREVFASEGELLWRSSLHLPKMSRGEVTALPKATDVCLPLWDYFFDSLNSVFGQRGDFTSLLQDASIWTRRILLSCNAATAETQRRYQALHDRALTCLFDQGPDHQTLSFCQDTKKASPSLAFWNHLAGHPEADSSDLLKDVYIEIESLVDRSAQQSSSSHQEADLLESYRLLFRWYLHGSTASSTEGSGVQPQSRKALDLFNKAKRRGQGDETWIRLVEKVWEQVCHEGEDASDVEESESSSDGE